MNNPTVIPNWSKADRSIANEFLRATVRADSQAHFYLASVELKVDGGWQLLLQGIDGQEFATSLGGVNASQCSLGATPAGEPQIMLAGQGDGWEATAVITLAPGQPVLRREQTYHFRHPVEAAIHPGFALQPEAAIRYTYPVQVHEKPLAGLPALHKPADWAVPFPFHVWHNRRWVGIYGLDKNISPGTIEFLPPAHAGPAWLRVYYPDSELNPTAISFEAGSTVTLVEVIAAKALAPGDEPLLEADRLAASILWHNPAPMGDLEGVAEGIARYYHHCQLWEPEAFGPGRGWFTNMWVRTQTGPAKKRGEYSGFFDLGWGEGIAVEMWMGAVRYWLRTGKTDLLPYVDEMTRSMDLFKRGTGPAAPYYDRSDGQQFGDFLLPEGRGSRIWTHSLGHTASHLIQLYQLAPHYPDPQTREHWLQAATSIARFFADHQRENGDLQDIFGDHDQELNIKAHRITARAVVCGLWARLAAVTGEPAWTQRALRLAEAVAPEIERYEYYNQMIDTFFDPKLEAVDGEAAYYVLEGLVPLYASTCNARILALCKKAAAYGIAWTYFYNLPMAHKGIARGGQCCRTDIPLLYVVGPAKGLGPLLELASACSDPFFEQVARESAAFISHWQIEAPGQPWDGGMVHALSQYSGKHWGPDQAGQVDTGVSTGNSLGAIELWLDHAKKQHE